MTDLTTHPTGAGTPQPAATPVTGVPAGAAVGVAVADRRTLRHVTRAEQKRLSADAQVERRARAAQLDLELREQRRAAARRERDADAAAKRARVDARRARRAAWRVGFTMAMPRWADRVLFVLPILFPMAVAWVGQIRFAMTVMGWPLAAAIVFAAGFELSTAYVARLDWLSRAAGDSALLFRAATWGFAAGAATMNYWHAAGPGFAPTGEAVSYGLMSITGVVLWELLSTYRHRTALRAEGKRPAARPRFGLARWIWFRPLTRVAWLLALRDGYTTTEMAWRAAIGAVELYGSPKHARTAVRAGHPVPRPEPLDDNRDNNRDAADETSDHRDNRDDGHPRDIETRPEDRTDAERDRPARDEQRDAPHPACQSGTTMADAGPGDRDGDVPAPVPPADSSPANDRVDDARPAKPTHTAGGDVGDEAGNGDPTDRTAADRTPAGPAPAQRPPDDHSDIGGRRQGADGGTRARMEAFARARLAAGDRITGADLDRRFGTRDYGRRVLREVLAATDHRPAALLTTVVTPVAAAGRDDPAP